MRGMLYVVSDEEYQKFLDEENAKVSPPEATGSGEGAGKAGGDEGY